LADVIEHDRCETVKCGAASLPLIHFPIGYSG
jgi:hypothetical protein